MLLSLGDIFGGSNQHLSMYDSVHKLTFRHNLFDPTSETRGLSRWLSGKEFILPAKAGDIEGTSENN